MKVDPRSVKSVAATKSKVAQILGIPAKQDSLIGITKQRSWAPLIVRIVEHRYFECVVGLLIAFNCITIGMEVQYCPAVSSLRWIAPDDSHLSGASFGDRLTKVQSGEWNKYEPSRDCPATFLQVNEYVLTVLFLVEFFLRVLVFGKYYYCSMSKLLDAFLVWVTGVLVVFILEPLNMSPGNVRMFTILRAFRIMRVARLVQGNPMLKQAWVLIKGLSESGQTLLWTIVVIFFVNFAFGIVAVLFIGDSSMFTCAMAAEESDSHQECAHLADEMEVHAFFNGLGSTMFTLLQVMTGDSWASGIARPAMKFQPAIWLFFILYVAVAMLVLLNLVTAVIVENAMANSKQDDKQKLIELEEAKAAQVTSLKRVFAALDVDGSGEISEAEFIHACTNRQEIINKFKLLDFDEREMMNLFKDLEVSNDGQLSLEEFEHGLYSMQGDAKSKDIVRVQKAVERLEKHVQLLTNHLPLEGGGDSRDSIVAQSAFGKRKSLGRSRSPQRSPQRRSSPKPGESPGMSTCSTILPSPAGATSSVGSLNKSLPGPPLPSPAIRINIPPIDLHRLDPSVQELADVLVKHFAGMEQRMEQRLVTMEHRQTKALDAIASHLKMEDAIAAHLKIYGKSNLSNITTASEYV
jgi:voltage-gated sodium channel